MNLIEEAERTAHFHMKINPSFGQIGREAYSCAKNEAEAEAFIENAIQDARRELANDFGVEPSTLAITVMDRSPSCFSYNPALVWVFAAHSGRERWCEVEVWTRELMLEPFRKRVARVLRNYPAHVEE